MNELTEKAHKIWNQKFFKKPFPPIKIHEMESKEFEETLRTLKKIIRSLDMEEYGRETTIEETMAFVFWDKIQGSYQIMLRLFLDVENVLEHELEHIYRGEV